MNNIFADLGLKNPDELLFKSKLIMALNRRIKKRGLTLEEVSDLFHEDKSNTALILRGRPDLTTSDRLILWHHRLKAPLG